MLSAVFRWNWPSGSGNDYEISSVKFLNFVNYPPLGKGRGPSFEQIWIPFTQGYFVSCLVEIGNVVLGKKILKIIYLFLIFPKYLPLGMGLVLHFEQILISFIQECIVPSSVETGSVVLEKILKFYYFQIIPLRKSGVLPLNKLDFSLPKDSLCQVWLKRASLF